MGRDRFLFGLLYRFGYTPWDGHKLPRPFTEFIEGQNGAPGATPAEVLDIGCGTGDLSIYLAKHKWTVTAVDFVDVALAKARAKAEAAGVTVRYLRGDATKLSTYSLGTFPLVIDGGCMHGFSDPDRDAYVRELEKTVKSGRPVLPVCLRRSETAAASPGYQPAGSRTALRAAALGAGFYRHRYVVLAGPKQSAALLRPAPPMSQTT